MYLLGLNAYHGDSSACIFKDDVLIAAIEEERLRRIKHWAGLPTEAIKFCLDQAGISLDQVDHITISRDPKAKILHKLFHVAKNLKTLTQIGSRVNNTLKVNNILDEIYLKLGSEVEQYRTELKFVEHHRSHLASSYYASSYAEAALLSIDGMGDFTSCMKGFGKKNRIKVFDSISYPHSLGFFYTAMTQYLGFAHYGDEYKVMGLSSYGTPSYTNELWNLIDRRKGGKFKLNSKYFDHFKNGVAMAWNDGAPTVGRLFTENLTSLLGPERQPGEEIKQYHMDLAASIQSVTEAVIFDLATDVYNKTKSENLCLSGGVAQNSVANGKITENTPFKNLYVPPAGHDAGTSVGSCLYFYHNHLNQPVTKQQDWAYTGAGYTNIQIKQLLESKSVDYFQLEMTKLYDLVTDCIANGGVVGWFQGRAEFGPRALGNRSILADPRRTDAKDILNSKIKRRESFRPFAPSVLKEMTQDFFEKVDDVPYMEKVYKIREEKRHLIPAVTHVDGTGRLQTVDSAYAPKYHSLISKFNNKTGIPILLNTSFNENEPIVNAPEEALDCFMRTKMDMLVMEDLIIQR